MYGMQRWPTCLSSYLRVSIISEPLGEDVLDTNPTTAEKQPVIEKVSPNKLNHYHLLYWRSVWISFMRKMQLLVSSVRVDISLEEKAALDLTQHQQAPKKRKGGQSDDATDERRVGSSKGGRILLYAAAAIAAVSIFTYSYGHRLQQWIPKSNKVFVAGET